VSTYTVDFSSYGGGGEVAAIVGIGGVLNGGRIHEPRMKYHGSRQSAAVIPPPQSRVVMISDGVSHHRWGGGGGDTTIADVVNTMFCDLTH
jgi:hypothetical protein